MDCIKLDKFSVVFDVVTVIHVDEPTTLYLKSYEDPVVVSQLTVAVVSETFDDAKLEGAEPVTGVNRTSGRTTLVL